MSLRSFFCLILSVACLCPPAAQPQSVIRGPYLQMSTSSSIVIRWRTDAPVEGCVRYGTNSSSLELSQAGAGTTNEHVVTLTNLLADTRYYYAVGTAATNLSGPDAGHYFLTHPAPGTPKAVRIWVIGDAGTANANQEAVRDAFNAFNGTNDVHAWLQLGDNAYYLGYDSEYQAAVFNMYRSLLRRSVTWPTLGNHDSAGSSAFLDSYPYFDIFTLPTGGEAGGVPSRTEHYYSYDLGMVHFICLDSMTASRAPDGAMALWLVSDLAMNTNRWTVAYWHHPPYSKGSHNSDAEWELVQMRENILPLLEAGGVDLVLSGHSHSYERSWFINGHYGVSSTFSPALIVQPGPGRETNGAGAYRKYDTLGEAPHGNGGAIYAVAGSSGMTSGGALNHPAMFSSQNVLGSMVLDFTSNRLDALFLPTNGVPSDWFTLIKEGSPPPMLTRPVMLEGGGFQFTVECRGHRTNVIEYATNSLLSSVWLPIATNVATNGVFRFTDTNAPANPARFYRLLLP